MRGMTSTALPPTPIVSSQSGSEIATEKSVDFTELEMPSAPGAILRAANIVVTFPTAEPEAGALERTVVYCTCLIFSLGCWASALTLVRAVTSHL